MVNPLPCRQGDGQNATCPEVLAGGQLAGARDVLGTPAAREQAAIADTVETLWQHVQRKKNLRSVRSYRSNSPLNSDGAVGTLVGFRFCRQLHNPTDFFRPKMCLMPRR
jgi:hypothetical protein